MPCRTSLLCLCVCLIATISFPLLAKAQATAELHVNVKDAVGAAVTEAKISVRDEARNFERVLTKGPDGEYRFLLLPPGQYTVTVEAAGFTKVVEQSVRVTVGQTAVLPVSLSVAAQASELTVTGEADIIETQRTSSATTIDQTRIDNLPINGRNYVNFTLTNSQVARDNAPSIGAAPTSGLNVGGQRARSNLVNVDGADAVDNSTNGIRSTVSQEAVQEFQLITNGYQAEYGRASGGVVNIITRSGSNAMHGTAFGYLRNRSFQAVNPFSNVPDPAYTRVQAGFNLGGPVKKDKTFYFLSYETTRRQETGFSTIGADNYGLVPFDASALFGAPPGVVQIQATPQQAAFLGGFIPSLGALPPQLVGGLQAYTYFVGASSGVAVNGAIPRTFGPLLIGGPNQFVTSCFFFTPTQNNTLCNGLPASFTSLNSQAGNYPVHEGTSIVDARLDHKLTSNNSLSVRGSVSPSTVSGIQVQGQNQNFGQNAFSRTAIQQFRDFSIAAQDTATFGGNKVNEFRFQYARRGLLFDYNTQSPFGGDAAVNIVGSAFIGREPFSFIRRTEKRYQFVDNFSISKGTHNIKFGGDYNHLPVVADFTVNFGGVYNFSNLTDASELGFAPVTVAPGQTITFPGFNSVQAYGMGIPSTYIQGIGNPHAVFNNNPFGVFVQDSWRIKSNLTLNYGVRYDVEFLSSPTQLSAISQQAYAALGIINGIPRDSNNFAPRLGIAWDPFKDGKTVVRASYGLFYDHPLLGLQFLAQATDASGTPQVLLFGSGPCGTSGGASPLNLNATNTFQGILQTPNCLGPQLAGGFGYQSGQQRFDSFFPDSLWINQNFLKPQFGLPTPLTALPFGFPLGSDFQYAYSNQASLSIERDLGRGYALSVGYSFNGGRHLNRPINANTARGDLLAANMLRAVGAGDIPAAINPLFVTTCDPAHNVYPAALVNFFRPSGLNPTLAPIFGAGCSGAAQAFIASQGLGVDAHGNPLPEIPFSDMSANFSNGSSVYHGLTANLRKRLSTHYEFLASYTWSHAIDDSTDLESPLAPQDSYHPEQERSNSTFDQRHRFVFSGVYTSGRAVKGEGFVSKLLSDWTVAPIIEAGSGRPYLVTTGDPTNLEFAPNSARPNVVAQNAPVDACGNPVVSSPFIPGYFFQEPCILTSNGDGNLGRNHFTKPSTVFTDMRVARRLHFTESLSLDAMVDAFNFINKFNVADVNPLCSSNRCIAGQPTAAFDPRQFQFALRLSW
jgi:hypothetical protein